MARTIKPANVSHDRGLLVLVLLAAITAGLGLATSDAPPAQAAPTPNGYALVQDVNTAIFDRMVDFALIPGTTDQAVVVSQHEARVRRVSLTGAFQPADYGNLSDRVRVAGDEEGLLSIAFSPNFGTDGRVYVYYTSLNCTAPVTRCTHISRFQVVSNVMVTGVGGETVVLEIDQEIAQSNHDGGRILFGPDGYLYLSVGDGGGAGDPNETGQDINDLLGSVLRINVTGQLTYTIPADNPFVGVVGDGRLWAYGLRNPWRYSFDRVTGDLWLADVGQAAWEEVEKITRGGNYGWDCYEGNVSYEPAGCTTPPSPFIFPRAVYDHTLGCSVTGGYVYRGTALQEIYGWYVYGDYCSGRIWAVNPADSSVPVLLVDTAFSITSFAELPNGELLVLTFNNAIYRLTCAATPDTDGDGQGNACDLDDDNDAWSDAGEAIIGTDPLDKCANTPAVNDEADDRWPADINDSMFSDSADIAFLTGDFGDPVPAAAPRRHDVSPDPPVSPAFVDTQDIARLTNLFGVGCGP
jgi:glucose/arabinose dehydrogenase